MFNEVQSRTRELKVITGSFKPNGATALAASTPNTGDGFTAARSSKGKFVATLFEKFASLCECVPSLRMAGAHAYKVNVGAVDVASAKTIEFYVESCEPLQYYKAADGAANTTTAETVIGRAAGLMPAGHTFRITPQAGVTAHDTTYATITIKKRTAGGSATTVAEITTKITGGTGDWTAFSPVDVVTTEAIAAGDALTITIAKASTGVQLPIMSIDAGGLQDLAAADTTIIEFAALLKNSAVSG